MSYYGQGDYYQGDYYQGDPGLFSFLGKIGKGIFGAAKGAIGGFLKGGPIGAVTGAAGGAISEVSAGELEAAGPRGLTDQELAALHARDARLIQMKGQGLLPGRAPSTAMIQAPAGPMMMMGPGQRR